MTLLRPHPLSRVGALYGLKIVNLAQMEQVVGFGRRIHEANFLRISEAPTLKWIRTLI
jgi:hypothetical protein